MKIKPATELHAHCLQNALDALIIARAQLHMAECPQALAAVRRALKSAEGAQRHMLRRLQHRDPVTSEPLRREPDGRCPKCDYASGPEALYCTACAEPLHATPPELGDLSRLPIVDQIRIRERALRGTPK